MAHVADEEVARWQLQHVRRATSSHGASQSSQGASLAARPPLVKATSALCSLSSLRNTAATDCSAPPTLQRWHSSSGHITRLRQLAAQGADHLQRLHDGAGQ